MAQYELKFHQEEVLWAKRSRVQWLKQGDANTKFFLASAKLHHSANFIHLLKDDSNAAYASE